ncbi:MAG: M56 family metallopeptidase [Chitinophagaceae bacterium]|nr:MAG: M56 family metallopeptidase [Chitinophagaceae bacterium]
MHYLTEYLLKVSLSITLLACFYQIVLRPLTFYKANRYFLLAAVLCSFLFPLVNIAAFSNAQVHAEPAIISWVPVTETVTARLMPAPQQALTDEAFLTTGQWLLLAWTAGAVVLMLKLLVSIASLQRVRRKSSVMVVNGIEACTVNESIVPFSFGNKIFLPSGVTDGQGLSKILAHELVHVKQWHTADILLAEFACILQWFNPFAWMLRKAIRQNLEFIADHHVISTGVGRQEYQLLLLHVMGRRSYGMTSQFNLSSLKNRIMMMNKNRNSRTQLLRFAIIIPLAALLLLSFRKLNKPHAGNIIYKAVVIDLDTRKPVEGVQLKDIISGRETTTGKDGVAEISFPAMDKNKLQLMYHKEGYINLGSTLSLSSQSQDDLVLTELAGMRQGTASSPCVGCFTSMFMGENTVLQDPLRALDLHIAQNEKTQVGAKTFHLEGAATSAPSGNGTKTGQVEHPAAIRQYEGDSLVVDDSGSAAMYGNVKVEFRPGQDYKGLIIVNGKEMDWKAFRELTDSTRAGHMPVDAIAEIRILNAKEGAQLYGKKGAAGVLIINAKKVD